MVIVGISVVIITKEVELEDYDQTMVSVIKEKLIELNKREKETKLQPRFEWSCHKDCTWIAVSIIADD